MSPEKWPNESAQTNTISGHTQRYVLGVYACLYATPMPSTTSDWQGLAHLIENAICSPEDSVLCFHQLLVAHQMAYHERRAQHAVQKQQQHHDHHTGLPFSAVAS